MVLSGRNQCLFGLQTIFSCSNNNLKMANRVSNAQLEELLEYLAVHPSLAKGVGLGARSKAVDRQWNDLARKLNYFGSGSSKTGERWKKYWADIKHKTKTRLARRRQDALSTGGGPSNQEDLSEFDKKVLAIIGQQAVYGDTEHRPPIFNIQPEVPAYASLQPEDIGVSEEVVMSDPSEFPVPVANPVEPELIEREMQQVPEPHQTGAESTVSQPARNPPGLRRNRPNPTNTATRTRIDPEWVMDLERSRVQAEDKMASTILMMGEAANNIAEASLINAQASQINVDISRKQLEVLNKLVQVVGQLSSVLAVRDSH